MTITIIQGLNKVLKVISSKAAVKKNWHRKLRGADPTGAGGCCSCLAPAEERADSGDWRAKG